MCSGGEHDGTPGLSVRQFFDQIQDSDLREFIDPGVLSILDAVFGGQVHGEGLRRIARTLVDVDILLAEEAGRKRLLPLVPHSKHSEFEVRVGRKPTIADAGGWTPTEIDRARDFFGLFEERIAHPPPAPCATILPDYGLFDHQRDVVRRLQPLLFQDERRAVLHLPTGVGKTRTAMHVVAETLRQNDPAVVVWLASGKELLEQAVEAFQQSWKHLGNRPLGVGSMWGDHFVEPESFCDGFLAVSLAKGWARLAGKSPDWAVRLSPRIRLVVFDEAHQSIAKTYRRITEELTLDHRCALLGLTATPGRSWADIDADGELAKFYSGNKVGLVVPSTNPIEYLIERGYLARPTFITLLAEPGLALGNEDLNRISNSLDIPAEIVGRLTMSHQYVTAVLSAIQTLLREGHMRILVFAATVNHARLITAILIARDVRSGVVTATTPPRVREHAIRVFKGEDPQAMVLVNFGVLTAGFDAPKASATVIARPTQSLVLYSQMVGRAIRGPRAGGTDACKIVTVVDPALPGFGDVAAAFLNWEDVWA